MTTRKIVLTLALVYFRCSYGQHQVVRWLESPRLSNYGKWGKVELCPPNSWVGGMNVRVEESQGRSDDTGLNSIKFLCFTLDGKHIANITSQEGPFGVYRGTKYCNNGFGTGFQLRSELKHSKDAVAAVDLKLRCTNGDGSITQVVGGGFLKYGVWTEEQICPRETAICGIVTQVQQRQGTIRDDTSLNNINVACCKVPHPLDNCNLETKWENVITCHSGVENCNIKVSTGVVKSQQHSNTMAESTKFFEQLGYGIGLDSILKMFQIKAGFDKKSTSETINGKTLSNVLSETNSFNEEWSFNLGCVGAGEELVIICGDYKVKTKEFRCVPD